VTTPSPDRHEDKDWPMSIDPALTPYIEEAQQFNSHLGDRLRPALDTPEAITAQRRRTGDLADQQLARGLAASTPPGEETDPKERGERPHADPGPTESRAGDPPVTSHA
jgi:hypothetical protein